MISFSQAGNRKILHKSLPIEAKITVPTLMKSDVILSEEL